jgi:ketosteroid isomerase-like protein
MNRLDTVHNIYAAFARGEIADILAWLAEDVAWEHELPGYGVS